MWEDSLGKVKTKRNIKCVKPYERPKSVLRRVTDSITGLLPQPAWLSNLFQSSAAKEDESSSSGSEGVGGDEEPLPSTSSTEGQVVADTRQESFIFQRPQRAFKENGNAITGSPAAISHPTTTRLPTIAREVPILTINAGDEDTHSESTSGCSSLLPHPEHRRELCEAEPLTLDRSSLDILGETLSKSLAKNDMRGRKTLNLHSFSINDNNNTTLKSANDDTSFNRDIGANSSLYMGDEDVSIGVERAAKRELIPQPSASSSKRPRFNVTSFGPSAVGVRKSLLNESIADSPFYSGRTTYGGASAYRRASLQTSLTPYADARKRVQARPSSATPLVVGSAAAAAAAPASSTVVLSSTAQRILNALEAMSTPVRDAKRIPTPTAAASARKSLHEDDASFTGFGLSRRRPHLGPPVAKLPLQVATQVVAAKPSQTAPAGSVPSSVVTTSTPIQAGGKIRARVGATSRASLRAVQETQEMIPPELPEARLPLSSLPTFNLLPATPVAAPTAATQVRPAPVVSTAAPAVVFTAPAAPVSAVAAVRSPYTFSAPLVTVSPTTASALTACKPVTFNFSTPLMVDRVSPAAPAELNKAKDVAGAVSDAQPPAVMVTAPVVQVKQPESSGFGDKFKPVSGSWTCTVCCVSNAKDKTICAACETPKPGAAPADPAKAPLVAVAKAPSLAGFGDKFKMSTDQWECQVCMVRNANCDNRCKSCETPRPGAKVAAPAEISAFKFGVPASSATPAVAATTAGFKFGALAADSAPKNDSAAPEPSSGFKFGATPSVDVAPKSDSTPASDSSSGFKFGAVLATDSAKKDEAPAAGFKFGAALNPAPETTLAPAESAAAAGGFKFGSTLGASKDQVERGGFKFGDATTEAKKAEDEAAPVFKLTSMAAPAAVETPKPAPIFSFGAPAAPAPAPKDDKVSSGFKPAAELKMGSVMDILGKKPEVTPAESVKPPALPVNDVAPAAEQPALKKTTFEQPAAAPSTFTFGAPSTAAPSLFKAPSPAVTTASSFTFGQPAKPPAAPPALPLFGSEPVTTSAPAFGATPAASVAAPVFGSAVLVVSSTPAVFGSTSSTVSAPAFGAVVSKPAPMFGAPSTTTSAAAPIFGAPSTTGVTPAAFGGPAATPATSTVSLFGAPSSGAEVGAPSMFGAAPAFGASSASTTNATFGATPAAATSLFTFGSTATTSATAAVTTTSAPAVAPASSGIFAFGQSSAAAVPAPSATSSFSFGSTAAPATSVFQFGKDAAKPSGFAGFSGATPATTTAAATPFSGFGAAGAATTTTQSETAKSSVFSFGSSAPATSSAPTAPSSAFSSAPFAFGAMPSAAPAPMFGGPKAAQTEVAKPSSSAPALTPFGSTAAFGSSAPAPAFSFGAPAAAPVFSTTPNFAFGAAPAPATGTQAAAPQSVAAPVFQFGGTPAMGQGGFPSFAGGPAFGANEAPPPAFGGPYSMSNPFDANISSSGAPRKIRKAVRRR